MGKKSITIIILCFSLIGCASRTPNALEPIEENPALVNIKKIYVVIGNGDDNINELISELINEVVKDKYDLTIKPVFYGEELMEIAENDDVDIFIVIVNNIRFRPSYPPQERTEKSLQLIAQIEKTYGKPVIALSPALLEANVKKTGADFYFPLPFNFDDFKAAFEKCISYKVLRRAR